MHRPRKRFGQNFLHDKSIIQRIVNAISPQPGDNVVEIGPGQGALTVPILRLIHEMDAIELDRDLIPALTQRCADKGLLHIHQADALTFDFSSLRKNQLPLRVIGNLPYNISTPLIFHLLSFTGLIRDMHFMLQKEVVDRLAAEPGSEAYGRLSVMAQYHCKISALFDVPPSAFYPPPQVNSSIVRLIPHAFTPYLANDYSHFSNIVKEAFSHRRKTLRNSLKHMVSDDHWKTLSINPQQRAEELGVEAYVMISNHVLHHPC